MNAFKKVARAAEKMIFAVTNPIVKPLRKLDMFNPSPNRVGATAIEYGLIAACISIAIIAVAGGIGSELSSAFEGISKTLGGN